MEALNAQIKKLEQIATFKDKYESLTQDYNDLLTKYNLQQTELESVKQELIDVTSESNHTISRLKV